MAVDEWNCPKCTYYHKYGSQRCMMCGALRVSKEQMRDFVAGVGVGVGGGAGGRIAGDRNVVGDNANSVAQRRFNDTRTEENGSGRNSLGERSTIGGNNNMSSLSQNYHQWQHQQQSTGIGTSYQQPAMGGAAMQPAGVVGGGNNSAHRPKSSAGSVANPYSKKQQTSPAVVNPYCSIKQSSKNFTNENRANGNSDGGGSGVVTTTPTRGDLLMRTSNGTSQLTNNASGGGPMQHNSTHKQTPKAAAAAAANSSQQRQGLQQQQSSGMQNNSRPPMQQQSYQPAAHQHTPKAAASKKQRQGLQQQQQQSCVRNPYAAKKASYAPPLSSPSTTVRPTTATSQNQAIQSGQQMTIEHSNNISRPNSSYQQQPTTGWTANNNGVTAAMATNTNRQHPPTSAAPSHPSSEPRPPTRSAAPDPMPGSFMYHVLQQQQQHATNAPSDSRNNNLHQFFSGANPPPPQQQYGPAAPAMMQSAHSSNNNNNNPSNVGNNTTNHQQRRQHQTQGTQGTLASFGIQPVYNEGPIPLCTNTRHNWIYPIDEQYPERDYQLQMSQASIMQNTLVSLPTGLGKTLIAAVVMYNYYRWFPTGKVVFCAPTRPLVSQQIHACYKIMGIPESHTAEITGRSKPENRNAMWSSKRVFFCTPQTLVKDIQESRCVAKSIVCVVMDEGHRATGEHANAVLVRLIEQSGAKFRLVGLSATPGSDIKSIQAVLTTLHISRIEARTEDDPNVKKYIHQREEEVIVVKHNDVIKSMDRKIAELMSPILSRLREEPNVKNRLHYDSASLKGYSVMQAREHYVAKTKDYRLNPQFHGLQCLCEARALLKEHGVHMAMNKLLKDSREKSYMGFITRQSIYESLMREMKAACGGEDANGGGNSNSNFENNPKLNRLVEVLTEHFERKRAINESTRVIVFSQWRESVCEIVQTLTSQTSSTSTQTNLLRPAQFIGQANAGKGKKKKGTTSNSSNANDTVMGGRQDGLAGMNQAQQQRVLAQFSEGVYNVLVCTCVGEEGLDMGEVDLIVHFDIMKSAIRSIQRSGRTGRKRNGRVVFLLAEGTEEQSYRTSVTNTKKIARALTNPSVFKLCQNSPMFPAEPSLMRKKMNVTSFHLSQVGGHTPKTRRGRNNNGGGTRKSRQRGQRSSSRTTIIDTNWRLDSEQDEERQRLFGDLPRSSSCREYENRSNVFPPSLRRRYLSCRSQSSVYAKMLRGNEDANMVALGVGMSSIIVNKLEKQYCTTDGGGRDDTRGKGRAASVKEASNVGPSAQQNPADSFDDNDCRSVDFGSDNEEDQNNDGNGPVESLESNRNGLYNTLDDIFGPTIAEDERDSGSSEPARFISQIATIFDEAHHKNCSVVPPPGMELDESSEESESVASASSDVSMNEDLCAFFDKNSSDDFRVEYDRDDGKAPTMKTPCSADDDSDVDFGANNDNLEFGTPRGDNNEADAGSNQQVADASKCLETLVIDGEIPRTNAPDGHASSKPTGNDEEEQLRSAVNEKENIDTQSQLSLSPAREDKQLGETRPSQHQQDKSPDREQDGSNNSPPDNAKNEMADDDLDPSFQLNEENAECINHSASERPVAQKEVPDQVAAAFRLPTPPPSSDESDDDSESEKSALQNSPKDQLNHDGASLADAPQPMPPDNASETNQFERFDDFIVEEDAVAEDETGNCKSFLQLPTQYSSSSEEDDDDDNDESTDRCPSDIVCAATTKSMPPPPAREREVETAANATAASKNKEESCLEQYLSFDIANNDESVQNDKMQGAEDLADTPIKASSKNTERLSRMSLDSLNDTPLQPRRNAGHQRKSLDSLTDTPIHSRKNDEEQQRKRLRMAPKDDSSKKPEHGTVEKQLQQEERVKRRIEEKYKCRFLECEAANDDSEESDEEDALRQIEDEEMNDSFINDTSQLGYSQDDLDRINADAEIEDCADPGETVLHRQFDHQHNIDTQFKTPVFNRRMRAQTPASQSQHTESSQKGLGNMNFIRSVLEHHRQGGNADELEDEYHRLLRNKQTQESANDFDPQSQTGGAEPMHANPHSSTRDGLGSQQNNVAGAAERQRGVATAPTNVEPSSNRALTAEQRAAIEAKRLEALKKRQERMRQQAAQQTAPFNPYAK